MKHNTQINRYKDTTNKLNHFSIKLIPRNNRAITIIVMPNAAKNTHNAPLMAQNTATAIKGNEIINNPKIFFIVLKFNSYVKTALIFDNVISETDR